MSDTRPTLTDSTTMDMDAGAEAAGPDRTTPGSPGARAGSPGAGTGSTTSARVPASSTRSGPPRGPSRSSGPGSRIPWTLGGHLGLVIVLLIIVIVTALSSDAFLTVNNLINVLRQVSVLAVIGAGLTLLMIAGGMDFSMGSNAVVTMAITASLLSSGMSVGSAALIGIVCAALIGLVNGLVVTFTNVTPFVATLAMATLLDGLALLVIDGQSVSAGADLIVLGVSGIAGIPYILIIALIICIGVGLTLKLTTFGRNVFAIGGNESAARLSGIPVRSNKLALYSGAGLLAGIAGVMLLARLGAASPGTTGLSIELEAVAAVVIGGTAISGGRGTMIGTGLGVILIGTLGNSMNLLGVSAYFQVMAVGAVLLIAAIANSRKHDS